ncbi:MAG: tRNA (adenosine(37)-N6)-dimethylallyltransferase MiaA [Lactobacillaceae bacterium]|jgi:tRNA dimethylallyltransferase|nr:tRNA (adenosine(37)-N6)-dimethylallyltransferase MiaA [Lactobacillaceae bacterium]
MQKLIVIVGPTAVGKTALSIELSQYFNGEVVSGDSMQIYRGLDIGTAKATPSEQAQVPHHMLDIVEPSESYSAAKFVEQAQDAIAEITSRGKLPILVGGTGFYVQALLGDRPLAPLADLDDPEFTQHWEAIVHEQGEQVLRDELKKYDAVSAERILPGQIRRMIRALLVSVKTGIAFSAQQPEAKRQYDAYIIGLTTDRERLYERINQRVQQMIETGLLDEAKLVQNLPDTATAKKAIGYKELFPVLNGQMTKEEGITQLQQASRRYAKRQITWFNNQFTDIHWYDLVSGESQVAEIIKDISEHM